MAAPSPASHETNPQAASHSDLPGTGIRGRLRDGLGNLLADCDVWIEPMVTVPTATGPQPWLVRTDGTGRFAVQLPAGRYAASAHPRDLPAVALGDRILVDQAAVDLGTFTLADAPHIPVDVRERGGRALHGAAVVAAPLLESWGLPAHARAVRRRQAVTNAAGRSSLRALPPGRYVLQVEADACQGAATEFEVTAAVPVPVLAIELAPTIERTGVVKNGAGDPLPGLAIAFEPCGGGPVTSCRTDGAGAFRAHLAGASCWLRLWLADGSQFVLEFVVPGGDPLTIVLPTATPASGQVTDRSGRPLSPTQVRLLPAGPQLLGPQLRLRCVEVTADREGTFRCPLLPSGRYLARVASEAGYQTFGPLDLPAAKMNFTVEPPARLSGRVIDDHGLPLIGEPVTCIALDQGDDALSPWLAGPAPGGRTDRLGHFEFVGLPAGEHVVRCASNRLAPALSDPVTVAGGKVTRLSDLRASGGAFLSGRVLRHGRAVPGALVIGRNRAPGGGDASARTAANGDYRLGPLAAGAVDVVYAPSPEPGAELPADCVRLAITLHAGEDTKRDLLLP